MIGVRRYMILFLNYGEIEIFVNYSEKRELQSRNFWKKYELGESSQISINNSECYYAVGEEL
jgi:hypothetical protein